MKYTHFSKLFFIVVFLFYASIYSHGFHSNTIIHCSNNDQTQTLTQIVSSIKKSGNAYVKSYDQYSNQYLEKNVLAACFGQVPCYCIISLSENRDEDIICSPMQNFYRISDDAWIPAHELVVGDKLLCESDFACVSGIKTVQEPLMVYMIEVEDTHTFLVGKHGLITHNIVIPLAATIGFSIPVGCGGGAPSFVKTSAGKARSFFGPIGIIGGIFIGGLVGIALKASKNRNATTCYDVSFKPDAVPIFMHENGASTKTVGDILSDIKPGPSTSGKTKQYEKDGTYEDALKDFKDLGPSDVKNMSGKEGKVGVLPDGRTVNVRTDSSYKTPTLEIYDRKTGRSIKIRYTDSKE